MYITFNEWLARQNNVITCLCFLVASYFFSIIGTIIIYALNLESVTWIGIVTSRSIFNYICTITITPFLETLIFQALPYNVLYNKSIFKDRDFLFIPFVALIFGALHYYSPGYMLGAFFIGIPLMWAYVFAKKHGKRAFVITTIIHAVRNLVAVIIQLT